jgi:frataxin-like iron-binding protein CyaY
MCYFVFLCIVVPLPPGTYQLAVHDDDDDDDDDDNNNNNNVLNVSIPVLTCTVTNQQPPLTKFHLA